MRTCLKSLILKPRTVKEERTARSGAGQLWQFLRAQNKKGFTGHERALEWQPYQVAAEVRWILSWALAASNAVRAQVVLVLPALLPKKPVASEWWLASDSHISNTLWLPGLIDLWPFLNVRPCVLCGCHYKKIAYHTFLGPSGEAWLPGKMWLRKLAFLLWPLLLTLWTLTPFFLAIVRGGNAPWQNWFYTKAKLYVST